MDSGFITIAVINLVAIYIMTIQWFMGIKKSGVLNKVGKQFNINQGPYLSVVIAACNEEEKIRHCVQSIMNQRYKGFELIVVNDRSTDSTRKILQQLQETYSITVIDIEDLPNGWLGKNHALCQGAKKAKGEWILFTDADIIFEPDCFGYSLGYACQKRLDHLTIIPEIIGGTFPYKLYFSLWSITVMWTYSLVKFTGIGAFNLIKKTVYFEIGSHEAIHARPDDDVKLGKLIVKKGFCQGVVFGKGLLRLEWYQNLRGVFKGVEKNIFALFDYSIAKVMLSVVLSTLFFVYPFLGTMLGNIISKALNLLTILIIFTMYGYNSSYFGNPWFYAFFHPITALIVNYSVLMATIKTILRNGIEWRGTKYPLKLLKKNII